MHLHLKFGNCTVLFLADSYVPWDNRLSSFAASDSAAAPDFTFIIRTAASLKISESCCIKKSAFYQVYRQGDLESWYYTFPDGQIYAACRETKPGQFSLVYLQDFKEYLRGNTTLFYISTLEYRLVHKGNLILHASYILDQGKAVLFAAPSGTGKSTQAKLWQETRGSLMVNGDRVLLHKRDGRWLACGWPMAGSSGISKNITSAIRAVVLLKKAPANTVTKLSSGRARSAAGHEIVLRPWHGKDVVSVGKLLDDFCGQVPVYTLSCTKDQRAVDTLFAALQRDGLYLS